MRVMILVLWFALSTVAYGGEPVPHTGGPDFGAAPPEHPRDVAMRMIESIRSSSVARDYSTIEGIVRTDSGRVLVERVRPDGIRRANAYAHSIGLATPREPNRGRGATDSRDECEAATDKMCDDAGHDGVKVKTVEITTHKDGCKTCSGECNSNGAVAFITETDCGGTP